MRRRRILLQSSRPLEPEREDGAAEAFAEAATAPMFDAAGVRVGFATSGRWVGRSLRPLDANDREPE